MMYLSLDGIDCKNLKSMKAVRRFLSELPGKIQMKKISRPKVINYQDCKKIERGITGFVILAESHISVHTYPFRKSVFIDVFSCRKIDKKDVMGFVKEIFEPKRIKANCKIRKL